MNFEIYFQVKGEEKGLGGVEICFQNFLGGRKALPESRVARGFANILAYWARGFWKLPACSQGDEKKCTLAVGPPREGSVLMTAASL